jgi:hypothetical protein
MDGKSKRYSLVFNFIVDGVCNNVAASHESNFKSKKMYLVQLL